MWVEVYHIQDFYMNSLGLFSLVGFIANGQNDPENHIFIMVEQQNGEDIFSNLEKKQSTD